MVLQVHIGISIISIAIVLHDAIYNAVPVMSDSENRGT